MKKSRTAKGFRAGKRRKDSTTTPRGPRQVQSAPGEPTEGAVHESLVPADSAPSIVGIGASAGGLEAFTQLLRALPADTGMAFVLVQHLEPKHESILPSCWRRVTKMPVHEVREGMRAEPNHVYVIPANADLSLMDGLLHIVDRKAPPGLHLPIDYFFRSLAESRGTRAIGVILSGTASDGTEGLKAIKVAGGITFAQQPESAKFDGMPRSAIAAVASIWSCHQRVSPWRLARIARHPFAFTGLAPSEVVPALIATEEHWTRLFRLLRTASGVDFTFYKKSTIKRRVARRMALHKIEPMGEYLKFMEGKPDEIDALFQDILIHVTSFFREPEVFAALQEKIFPQIMASKDAREPIRIWVPGCSTGEEAIRSRFACWSVWVIRSGTPIQIFGTDISDAAIEKARAAIYPEEALRDVSPQRLQHFLHAHQRQLSIYAGGSRSVRVCPPRRDQRPAVLKARSDQLPQRSDLLRAGLQKKVLAFFHYALKSTGVLLLGKSESLGRFSDLFTITDRSNMFFAKNPAATVPFAAIEATAQILAPAVKPQRESTSSLDLEKEADRIVWERYAHAGLVVNDDLQILHFRGDTSPYFKPTPG